MEIDPKTGYRLTNEMIKKKTTFERDYEMVRGAFLWSLIPSAIQFGITLIISWIGFSLLLAIFRSGNWDNVAWAVRMIVQLVVNVFQIILNLLCIGFGCEFNIWEPADKISQAWSIGTMIFFIIIFVLFNGLLLKAAYMYIFPRKFWFWE